MQTYTRSLSEKFNDTPADVAAYPADINERYIRAVRELRLRWREFGIRWEETRSRRNEITAKRRF